MSYSLHSAADAETERIDADWGSLTWLASRAMGNAEGLTLGRVVIRKGCQNPRHGHHTCEEALHLLSGKLEHTVGDEQVVLHPGDTLVVSAGVYHNARSIGEDDADMIVAYSSGTRDFQEEA